MSDRKIDQMRGGFTLTEMGVVIGIIAVIVVLALPALNKYRKRARTVMGLQHLNEIAKSVMDMTVANNNVLPFGYNDTAETDPDYFPRDTDWAVRLNGYLTGAPDHYNGFTGDIELLPIFTDPNATYPDRGYLHYSCHPVLMPDTELIVEPPNWSQNRLTRIRRSSEMILIMDGAQRPASSGYNAYATAFNIDDTAFNPWINLNGSRVSNPGFDETKVFFDKDANDNNVPIDPGTNDESIDLADIAWRQGGEFDGDLSTLITKDDRLAAARASNWSANFVFCDLHAATLKPEQVTKRNVRVDP